MNIKTVVDAIGRHIAKPINPYLISAIGFFSVLWSLYLYVPKRSRPPITYTLFNDYHIRELMFVIAFGVGIWLFSVPFWAKTIDKMILPLRILGVFWIFIAGFTAVGNWTTNAVVMYFFLSFFCIVSAANFSVNKDHPEYKNIFS